MIKVNVFYKINIIKELLLLILNFNLHHNRKVIFSGTFMKDLHKKKCLWMHRLKEEIHILKVILQQSVDTLLDVWTKVLVICTQNQMVLFRVMADKLFLFNMVHVVIVLEIILLFHLINIKFLSKNLKLSMNNIQDMKKCYK